MIGGVSFQPGQNGATGQQGKPKTNGVQEAVKVLSLRLPSVVGARAIAPQALLQSPGSGGNPRVDSVVSQVMGRMFPTGGAPAPSAPAAPMMPPNAPQFSGGGMPGNTPLSSMMPPEAFPTGAAQAPRITPINEGPRPTEVQPTPAGQMLPPGAPKQQIDVVPPARPSEGPGDGAGNVMNDFMEFLRRNQSRPMTQDTPLT